MVDSKTDKSSLIDAIKTALQEVKDPEIPVLSVLELGMIQEIELDNDLNASLRLSPTFVGCPAIDIIKNDVKTAIENLQLFNKVSVNVDFKTAWNSNMISNEGKKKLTAFGITPPRSHNGTIELSILENLNCAHCSSTNTAIKSTFGSTLCRSMHYCFDCRQSFEAFKPI